MRGGSFLNASSKILRMYPVTDGILASLRARGDVDNYRLLSVDGVEGCKELFEAISRGEIDRCFVEVNACKGSCVNGPVKAKDVYSRFPPVLRWSSTPRATATSIPVCPRTAPLHEIL